MECPAWNALLGQYAQYVIHSFQMKNNPLTITHQPAMSKVFVSIAASLDGFIAGPNGGPANPLGDGGMHIHRWMYPLQEFRKQLRIGEGGQTGADNDLLAAINHRTGACIMGKRMFEEGEANWPEEAPFHVPVMVLTHQRREPWQRKGGTTFFFVNDGIEGAMAQAKKAAGEKDIRISGGAEVIRQYLHAGLIDEFTLHLSPSFLGKGVRLFDSMKPDTSSFMLKSAVTSKEITHLTYDVQR